MISYVLPTRNRHAVLAQTMARLGSLPPHPAQVVVVDNASDVVADLPATLANGMAVSVVRLEENHGAAARNIGVCASDHASSWIVMLDDDSYPVDITISTLLQNQPGNVGAVMADIHLPRMKMREEGGLPEVFIGCGVAIRREAFESLAGYDSGFGYYVEEYDLAAKLIRKGYEIAFERAWRVEHLKENVNRDMNLILQRLVRNNGWVAQRYAPDSVRRNEIRDLRCRYRRIAVKENALAGFASGLVELRRTIASQLRTPLASGQFARFTGLHAATIGLQAAYNSRKFRTATIVSEGKNAGVVRAAMNLLGVREMTDGEVRIIGTMSPGPMLDAAEEHPEWIAPWVVAQTTAARAAA